MFLKLNKKKLKGDCKCTTEVAAVKRLYAGPPQQGAVGLPSGQNKGITGGYSLIGRIAFRNVPQVGAAQFGSLAMGAQRLVMDK